jgi:IclR family transcriptional regulator, KDG regulon repressor
MKLSSRHKIRTIVPSVEKAFKILEFMAGQKNAYTITELSRKFKIPISTMNNLLLTLVHCGYLRRNETGTFRVTMKLLDEAAKIIEHTDLRDLAQEDLERLTEETGLASILSVRDGDQIVCLDKKEGPSRIRVASNIGMHFPLHSTATGKLVLAHLSDEEVESIVGRTGLPPVTPHTITSPRVLRAELKRIRNNGYAVDNEETTIGIRGVAAPVFDHEGNVAGAISTGGVGFQIDDRIPAVIASVKQCARSVSDKLGYHHPAEMKKT